MTNLTSFCIAIVLFDSYWLTPCLAENSELLVTASGQRVESVNRWEAERRSEILRLFREQMYGQMPAAPEKMAVRLIESGPAYVGKAIRKQYQLRFDETENSPSLDLLIYLPVRVSECVPVILGMNFWGNHAVTDDPNVVLAHSFVESSRNPWCDLSGVTDNRATDACRGKNAGQWPIERMLDRGYGIATFYRNDVDCDDPKRFDDGVRRLYPDLQNCGDNFSTIGAWAWGISRAIDCLEQDTAIDAQRIAVFGWSRLGKAALWAAANDDRIAVTLSNEAGAGGAKLFRRNVGEDIKRLNSHFPHWFCNNFDKYNGGDETLPFDMHMMVALIAPRAVCIGGAEEDQHADPEGEFLALKAAEPVYVGLYGLTAIPAMKMPATGERSFGCLGFHFRAGRHDVLQSDWNAYLDFVDLHLKQN